jgi:hypothetical protein
MKNDHRTATPADYAFIVRMLIDGDQGILVRSLFRSDKAPYPLLSICQGPFQVTSDGIEGLSLDGKPHTLRIANTDLCNVELRPEGGEWFTPEMGGAILILP